jgi:hypothetical protein
VREALKETDDLDRVTDLLERKTADEFGSVDPVERERYEILSGMKTNAEGLLRYWRKRAEAEVAR